jgi:hypothetical protein
MDPTFFYVRSCTRTAKKKAKNENLKIQKINPPTPKKGGAPSRLLLVGELLYPQRV